MTRRAMTPERAEAMRVAVARAVLDYLRRAAMNIPARVIAAGLATLVADVIVTHVPARHRAETFERVRSILSAAEGRKR